jgi:cobalt/nickel transport system permease protein
MGYGNNAVVVTLKVLFSVTAANLLACTTQWNELTGVLKIFHLPDIFIFVFDITIKYIMLLGELAINMLYSLKLRSIGASLDKVTSLSGIIGTMFIISKDMSEEMFGAMECRGFTGEYKAKPRIKLMGMDLIFIILDLIFILTYFYFDRL